MHKRPAFKDLQAELTRSETSDHSWATFLGYSIMPTRLSKQYKRDGIVDTETRGNASDITNDYIQDHTTTTYASQLWDFLTSKFSAPDVQTSPDHEGLADMQAKAIADSLVTRANVNLEATEGRRRSVRILQLHNDDKQRNTIKSPTSAALSPEIAKKAKLRASIIGRPLVPSNPSRKTLILDLDETLIHSLSKGGKMSSGHMVEVKLGTHAILYYIHKRPHCDLFLEKVTQWYDVVIFTASVQEYADPVIDWLEQDKKYFKARYYRQHCTYRYGAYMKDLSIAEPRLSKAIIIDNSPLSYRINEENAIPIEGWISDPSDRDLLHLIPVLQNLHLLNDVRSLLSLRQPD